ncbi:MAG: hypothetical protein ACO39R_07170, partial [Pontimonas sp.]
QGIIHRQKPSEFPTALANGCATRTFFGDDFAVVTKAGVSRVLNDSRWEFPRFDDQSTHRAKERVARTAVSRRTRTTIAAIVGAAVGLIGVGSDNRYGHPTEQALPMLQSAGTIPIRSDERGTSTLHRSERGIELWSVRGG